VKKPKDTISPYEYELIAISLIDRVHLHADDADMSPSQRVKLLRAVARVCNELARQKESELQQP
jgi:hypothetical protein